jgi:ArsR family transcriptional regulator
MSNSRPVALAIPVAAPTATPSPRRHPTTVQPGRLLDAEPDADHLAEILKALAHPHRLRVFARLASCCSEGPPERLRVGELGDGLGIAPSTLSHHLRELRHAGLVQMAKQGQVTECWVEPGTLEDLSSFFTTAVCRLLCD